MFIDEAQIELIAGDGGDGCKAFRREKGVPLGGPFGGNGGKGSDIVFEVDQGLNTLIYFKHKKIIKGNNGTNGQGKGKYGKNAENIIIKVPSGTVITDENTGLIIADLTEENDKCIVAHGGRGGRGNMAFATKNNPAPDFAENGEPGETRKVKLELKLMADVGLVGLPSVGKSTFISKVTSSKPKIADYPFTTLKPNLGVVSLKDGRSFVIADLPGLIKGASLGHGLGIRFLKHIERTRIIVHIIDMSRENPYEDYNIINNELKSFNAKLLNKKQIVLANKMDIPISKENLEKFTKKIKVPIYQLSALTGQGIEKVLYKIADELEKIQKENLHNTKQFESHVIYKFEEEIPFTITKENGIWVIKGEKIEKLLKMSRLDSQEAILRFSNKLRHLGVDEQLKQKGAKEKDIIKILDYEFEFKDF